MCISRGSLEELANWIYIKGTFIRLDYIILPGYSNSGCLHTGDAENLTITQCMRLHVSAVQIWCWRPEDSWRAVGLQSDAPWCQLCQWSQWRDAVIAAAGYMNLPAGVKASRQSKAASYLHCHQEGPRMCRVGCPIQIIESRRRLPRVPAALSFGWFSTLLSCRARLISHQLGYINVVLRQIMCIVVLFFQIVNNKKLKHKVIWYENKISKIWLLGIRRTNTKTLLS